MSRGLSAQSPADRELLSGAPWKQQLEKNRGLRELALREMDLLQRAVAGAGRVVLLANEMGIVLDMRGDQKFFDRAARACLQPGACWDETRMGTNAIGTALVERGFVRVLGNQHFLDDNHFLVCSAMPIMSPTGELGGIVDLSGDARDAFAPGETIIRNAATNIEHAWVMQSKDHDLMVRLHLHPSWLNTPEEGVLVFRDSILTGANTRALRMLGLQAPCIQKIRWEEIFANTPRAGLMELNLRSGCGLFYASVSVHAPHRATTVTFTPPLKPKELLGRDGTVMDSAIEPLMIRAKRAVEARIPLLLQGETGTGKEVFVETLHRETMPENAPFVAVNCAAIPETLFESELFGYQEGAFTGARKQGSMGYIRRADGGTLFLDEIGDMPLSLQVQLLRVLQNGEVTPLGGGRPVQVHFQLVAATHRDLKVEVREGRFREDLYYRLCHLMITLPPLRDRAELALILDAMMTKHGAGRKGVMLSADLRTALLGYGWPGNLREMSNLVHTMVSMADPWSTVGMESVPDTISLSANRPASDMDEMTTRAMRKALEQHDGNVSAAAKQLGIHRSTLYRRVLR
jgi:transcriptional regulator of acetoin/glycerol metabolism